MKFPGFQKVVASDDVAATPGDMITVGITKEDYSIKEMTRELNAMVNELIKQKADRVDIQWTDHPESFVVYGFRKDDNSTAGGGR